MMGYQGVTLAFVAVLLATTGAVPPPECVAGGDFTDDDLNYMYRLYQDFEPIFREWAVSHGHPTRQQFAVMGLDFAGTDDNPFDPPEPDMTPRDTVNYAVATFNRYGHAEDNLMYRLTGQGGMLNRFRQLYGRDPQTIHLFTWYVPCTSCSSIMVNTVNDHGLHNIRIYIAYNAFQDNNRFMTDLTEAQTLLNTGNIHFLSDHLCGFFGNEILPPTTRAPHDELRQLKRSVGPDGLVETCPATPNLYRLVALTTCANSDAIFSSESGYSIDRCKQACDESPQCLGFLVSSTTACTHFASCNPQHSYAVSAYFKMNYPAEYTWFTLRNVYRGLCLVSRRRDNYLGNHECHPEYADQRFAIVNPEYDHVQIKAKDTGKCLQASPILSHEVCDSGSFEQQWQIQRQPDGTTTRIINVQHHKCLFVNARLEIGVWECIYDDQLWSMDVIQLPPNNPLHAPNGWMTIQSRHGCLVSRARDDLFLYHECHPEYGDQHFRVWQPRRVDDQTLMMLRSRDTGKCLAATDRNHLTHATCNTAERKQKWIKKAENAGEGTFLLMSTFYETCVYLQPSNHEPLAMFDCHEDYYDQRWTFILVYTQQDCVK
nr:ricin lectin domain-containing protein 8 [Arenicola marina]